MVPPFLTLLFAQAVALGVRRWGLQRVLPTLVAAWLFAMITSFVVAGVADDDDVGAFVASAVVLLALGLALWRFGLWLGNRRTDPPSR
jgi:O-antigen/teichoic acid export membrane protein